MPSGGPTPPDDLQTKDLPTHTYQSGEVLYRIQETRHSSPVHFGTSGQNRFDDPSQSFGICYLSESKEGAFVETIGRMALEQETIPGRLIETNEIVQLKLKGSLEVVDFDGPALLRLRGESSVTTGENNYQVSQQWAAAFHEHPQCVDGLRYRAKHQPEEHSVAIFERWDAIGKYLACKSGSIDEEHRGFLADMIRKFDLKIV